MRTGSTSPTIAYRETISRSASGERKYIRYFDGRGHFGHIRLQLIPHPGEPCSISIDAGCPLPEDSRSAARRALFNSFDRGPLHHLPLIGFEVQLTGGTYLPPYSHPEACAIAACMALDEAVLHGSPMIVEPYIGIRLLVESEALHATLRTLASLLGEIHAVHSITDIVQLDVEIPVRLYSAVKTALGLRVLDMIPLPRDQQYRPLASLAEDPHGLPDGLDEWT